MSAAATTLLERRSDLCRTRLSTSPVQAVLDLFKRVLAAELARDDFGATLQRIKALFVQRDYDAIFMTAAHLPVYVCEYVPSRVLCYVDLVLLWPELQALVQSPRGLRVCALGGGAGSDLVSLAAVRALVAPGSEGGRAGGAPAGALRVHTIDMGDWSPVLDRLVDGMRAEWALDIDAGYDRINVLQLGGDAQAAAAVTAQLAQAQLVTILFTVNELFQLDRVAAIGFVQTLMHALPRGAHVLVVDSAGDFSELKVGAKTFWVWTLLDALRGWTKLQGHESRWYRHPEGLSYPLELNNMRYFARLYRKV